LKSFEEKIREIEAARTRELEVLAKQNEERVEKAKDEGMKMVNDVLAQVRETTKQAKSIIDKAGMRPVDEYIAKKIGQC
jgi:hypothetical protein